MQPARRFYQKAEACEVTGGYGVRLDARALRTPGGNLFTAPTLALAEAVAAEWDAQVEHIAPASMPMTQLAFASVDVTPGRRQELAQTISKYIEADLVCHRADSPEALVARQGEVWGSLVMWAEKRFHIPLTVVTGVIAGEASPGLRSKITSEVEKLDDFRCTALAQATTLAGSAVIGFALGERHLDGPGAFNAAALDELWSLEAWGEDEEARARLNRLENDLNSVARFVSALG